MIRIIQEAVKQALLGDQKVLVMENFKQKNLQGTLEFRCGNIYS